MAIRQFRAWLQAARCPSQLHILLPVVWGQAYAFAVRGVFDRGAFFLLMLFACALQLFIVFANDLADEAGDVLNSAPTPFSGGSRVLVEGLLTRRQLARGASLAAGMALGLAAYGSWRSQSLHFLGLAGFALLLLWAYSFPPIRLSYRGGGELLQMLGLGLVLPLIGFKGQGGGVFPLRSLCILLPMQLAGALATTLPDAVADRAVGKMTLAAKAGSGWASALVVAMNSLAIAGFLAGLWRPAEPAFHLGADVVPAFLGLLVFGLLSGRGPSRRWMLARVFSGLLPPISLGVAMVLRLVSL